MTVVALPPGLGFACLRALANPASLKDDNLRYVWFNDAFADMFGPYTADIVGRSDDEVFVNGPLVPDLALEERVLATGKSEDRYETLDLRSGLERELIVSVTRVEHDGSFHLVQMIHDITEVAAANHMLIAVTEDLAAESRELRSQAMSDPLTGLLNPRGFQPAAIEAFEKVGGKGALAMLDLDEFKAINDHYGHGVGDKALQMVADALRESTRERIDVLGRIGGDEFVIALPTLSTATVDLVTARIRAQIADISVPTHDGTVAVSASLGIALSDHSVVGDLEAWRREADVALYEAKRQGKNCCVVRTHTPPGEHQSDD